MGLSVLAYEQQSAVVYPLLGRAQDGLEHDGKEYNVDALACATGFDSSHVPRFPIIGRNGATLGDQWTQGACAYMSHSVPNFPNYFIVVVFLAKIHCCF